MKALITGSLVAFALGVTAAAQDSTATTKTKVDGDDARAVTMRGCLQQQTAGNAGFLFMGAVTASGEDLKSKTTVKTDIDDDDTTVKTKSETKIDKDDDKSVGTSGSLTTYAVTPRDGVDLAAHAGQEVEIAAVMVDARKGGDDDAEIKIKETTKVERENAEDSKVESKTKAEVPRGAHAQLMAMSVKPLGRSCSVN